MAWSALLALLCVFALAAAAGKINQDEEEMVRRYGAPTAARDNLRRRSSYSRE